MRENSLVGESEMDRKSGGCVRMFCGVLIGLLVLAGLLLWWLRF